VAQVVECLSSKHEVLSSNPNTTKKTNQTKEMLLHSCILGLFVELTFIISAIISEDWTIDNKNY
jgi:hypothetical protein